jgi:hypothetical protein
MPTCYIFHFNSDGRIVENEVYYCKLRLLEQLGLADSEDTEVDPISWTGGRLN